ncbi:MAG: TspO/MBR family protein [Pseudomonadota bacterium]
MATSAPNQPAPIAPATSPASLLTLGLFLIVVVGGGIAIGAMTPPGEWYANLTKPPFNPPAWVFAPVWTTLYIFIAVAGWRILRREPSGWAMRFWGLQLVFNFLWSPVFFAAHRMDVGLVVSALMFASILGFIQQAGKIDPVARLLFLPYAAWISFATLLNASLLMLNGPTGQ